MSDQIRLVVFHLDDHRYAMPLTVVERVLRAVEVTALPKAPGIVLGLIDVEGRVLPVLNIRRKVGLPDREIRPSDQFMLAKMTQRTVVLVIDEAQGVIERPRTAITGAGRIVPGLEQIQGVIQLEDGLAMIYDLDRFLSLGEVRSLDEAMCQEAANVN